MTDDDMIIVIHVYLLCVRRSASQEKMITIPRSSSKVRFVLAVAVFRGFYELRRSNYYHSHSPSATCAFVVDSRRTQFVAFAFVSRCFILSFLGYSSPFFFFLLVIGSSCPRAKFHTVLVFLELGALP